MDISNIFEILSLLHEIYRDYKFTVCTGYILLNNILLVLLQDNLDICIHCEKDLLENIVNYAMHVVEKSSCKSV